MELCSVKKAQEFFESLPQSQRLKLTQKQQEDVYLYTSQRGLPLYMLFLLAIIPAVVVLFVLMLVLAAIGIELEERTFVFIMLGIMTSVVVIYKVYSKMQAKREIEAGNMRTQNAYLLDMESCCKVDIDYVHEFRPNGICRYELHITNSETGKEVNFVVHGMRAHTALTMGEPVVIIHCGLFGYKVLPKQLFSKVTGYVF